MEETEAAIAAAKREHEAELAEVSKREKALARERRDREGKQRKELERMGKDLAKRNRSITMLWRNGAARRAEPRVSAMGGSGHSALDWPSII